MNIMDYRTLAQSILQTLPSYEPQPKQHSNQSDDERIAEMIWTKMRLEISLRQPSAYRTFMFI